MAPSCGSVSTPGWSTDDADDTHVGKRPIPAWRDAEAGAIKPSDASASPPSAVALFPQGPSGAGREAPAVRPARGKSVGTPAGISGDEPRRDGADPGRRQRADRPGFRCHLRVPRRGVSGSGAAWTYTGGTDRDPPADRVVRRT